MTNPVGAPSSSACIAPPLQGASTFYTSACCVAALLDVISYTTAMSACEKGGQWQRALELLEGMSQRDMKPNVISYNAAILTQAILTQAILTQAIWA